MRCAFGTRVLGGQLALPMRTGCSVRQANTTCPHAPGKFADYMLVNAAVEVQSFDVMRDLEVSDHCPLVLDF